MSEGMTRLGRAAGAAALSTFSALALHVLAGGHAPSLLAVAVPLAASFAVAAQLAGRPLGRWRLAAILAASQLALHTSFSLGAVEAPALTGHAGHDPAALAAALGTPAAHAHAASMPLAHVLAGALTFVGIRRAGALLRALARLAALVARALLAGLSLSPDDAPAPGRRIVPAPRASGAVVSALLASLPSRAPPVAA
ncbi:hypothetical protein QQX09_09200 [Demequina sp. SYSU T00192]|uniref:Uncharacterized protein n=1 Tax=Demequina litoralis TaxID=3051660 RepID=A0ABT8GA69_9MICO|nr:hypothetical protein [Demequina sp. SYSU T00192]MDN4476028.1 hypothetical protein [Demequina sp. SYSU T00192]